MMDFIDKHRDAYGIEPICKVLQVAPSGCRRRALLRRDPDRRCARAKRDEVLAAQIERVWHANMQVYGADKVWRQLVREGTTVARGTVKRLMRHAGLRGALRGKKVYTTVADAAGTYPNDRVNRQFKAAPRSRTRACRTPPASQDRDWRWRDAGCGPWWLLLA
jgi:transposase InsO family protein